MKELDELSNIIYSYTFSVENLSGKIICTTKLNNLMIEEMYLKKEKNVKDIIKLQSDQLYKILDKL